MNIAKILDGIIDHTLPTSPEQGKELEKQKKLIVEYFKELKGKLLKEAQVSAKYQNLSDKMRERIRELEAGIWKKIDPATAKETVLVQRWYLDELEAENESLRDSYEGASYMASSAGLSQKNTPRYCEMRDRIKDLETRCAMLTEARDDLLANEIKLVSERDRYKKALEEVKRHMEMVVGEVKELSAVYNITRKALTEEG